MTELRNLLRSAKRRGQDVVGIDLDPQETRVVRLGKSDQETVLVACEILPKVDVQTLEATDQKEAPQPPPVLILPPKCKARYASLTVSGENAIVKLLSFPGALDETAEQKVVQSLGLTNPDAYRISYRLIQGGHGRAETRVLAVALPEAEACVPPQLLPRGTPAPYSLEISALASATAFLNGLAAEKKDVAVAWLDFGASVTTLAIFNKRLLALIRRFPVGFLTIVAKVQEALGVDRETAMSIFMDGAFDISRSVHETIDPLIKQLIVSRDFVERRENCRVVTLYAAGNFGASKGVLDALHAALGMDIVAWNPLTGLTVASGALPANWNGQDWRLAAAIGACEGTLEEA